MSRITLPESKGAEGKRQLEDVISILYRQSMDEQSIVRAGWLRNFHYLRGARTFHLIDRGTGRVEAVYQTESGQVNVQQMEVHARMRDEMGRMLQMDPRPACQKHTNTLDGMRKTATAQATLDYVCPQKLARELLNECLELLLKYGSVGLIVQTEPEYTDAGVRDLPVFEPIPPWELFPLPVNVKTKGKIGGIMRARRVSLDWLKKKATVSKADEEAMNIEEVYWGDEEDQNIPSQSRGSMIPGLDSYTNRTKTQGGVPLTAKKTCLLLEVWLEGPRRTCARWIVWAGGKLLKDVDYEALAKEAVGRGEAPQVVMMPLAVATYLPTDTFYSQGLVDMLFSGAVWSERMISRLFQFAEDADNLGILLVPQSWGISMQDLQRKSGVRFATYDPDIGMPDLKAQHLLPANMGTLPADIAKFAQAMNDRVLSQPADLMAGQAPGRVDSAGALQTLSSTSNIPLTYAAEQLAGMFAAVYRAALGIVRNTWSQGEVVSINAIEEAMVGLIIDPRTMTLSLRDNALPDPRDVEVGVRSQLPLDPNQRIAALWQSLQAGLITPSEFRWIAWRENLGIPTGNRAEIESRRKALLLVMLLFNDGATPGGIKLDLMGDNPLVFLEVVDGFMASVEFSLAEPAVKEAFYQLKGTLRGNVPNVPGQLPTVEDLPEQAQMDQQQATGGGPMGGMGMPPDLAQMMMSGGQ